MSCHVKSDCAVQHQHSHVPLSPFKRYLPLVVSSLVALFITTSCGCIDPTFTHCWPRIVALPPPCYRCYTRPPEHHSSNLTSVNKSTQSFQSFPPLTLFQPIGTLRFFHVQIILTLTSIQLKTLFQFQLFYKPLHFNIFPFVTTLQNIWDASTKERSILFTLL